MISKERLMELLVAVGDKVGFQPQRLPQGYVEFAAEVENEVRQRQRGTVAAIKESYRRLEFGANPIRIKQETDMLLDTLAGGKAPAVTFGGQLRALRCIEALESLVQLKRIKQRMDVLGEFPVNSTEAQQYFKLKEDYDASKDEAWQAAFDALVGDE